MKFLQLELAAFGHFTNVKLDFSQTSAGLHIIYGVNEAGKSTTLRAINCLLFGFPERTNDGFLHNNEQLRLGAQLQNSNGETLHFYRRKGRKNTLLNGSGQSLDESCLAPFIAGITEAQFTALFCFDHLRLRQGGEELLSAGGNLGESLFEAGSGGLKVHRLLANLDKEAGELFNPHLNAVKPKLNQAIRTYRQISQKIKEESLSPATWHQHANALEKATQQLESLRSEIHALQAQQRRLERIRRTRPLLQRQQELQAKLDPLRTVITLPEDAKEQRLQISSELHIARSQEKQARQIISELEAQLKHLTINHALLAQKSNIEALRERLGSHTKAARDLPGVRTEMRTLEAEAQQLLASIYPTMALSEVSRLPVTLQQRQRLKQLADSYPGLQAKYQSLLDQQDKLAQQLIQKQAELDHLPQPLDTTTLKVAVTRALKQSHLEDHLAKETREIEVLTTKAAVELKQLGLWCESLERLEQVAFPPLERVEVFDRRFKELENDKQRVKERLLDARQRLSRVVQKIEALRWTGEIPTEQDLLKAREVRQQYWQVLKQGYHASGKRGESRLDATYGQQTHLSFDEEPPIVVAETKPLSITRSAAQTFEKSMLFADEIVDRLRREANRVAEQANLLAEQQNAQQEQEQHTKKWHVLVSLQENLQEEWEKCWKPLGITPWSPSEMRSWLHSCVSLRQQVATLRERHQKWQMDQALLVQLRQELVESLAVNTGANAVATVSLTDLLTQAQTWLDQELNLCRHREELVRGITQLSLDQKLLETGLHQAYIALNTWHSEWKHVLTPLQLPLETSPDVARTVLDTLDQILHRLDKITGLHRRIVRMEEDATSFTEEVNVLVNTIAPALNEHPIEQVIPTLSAQLSQAEQAAARQQQWQQQLQTEHERLYNAGQQVQRAQTQLSLLLEQAHCTEITELEIAEQASARKTALQQQLSAVETQLREQGEGLSLEALREAQASVDIDQLPGQLQHCDECLRQREQERSECDQRIGELRLLLKQMDGNAAAAKAAEEAQLSLAEIRDLAERYMRLHLASTVLRQSIECYRERHQNTVMQRASELFQRLTLGRFVGLKAGYNNTDQPILLGLRTPDSGETLTSHMSDGTRDQLYLALRLASFEHHVSNGSVLPLILDDILVNFDDGRSLATLTVLSELSQRTQILFLTHHAHLVELAKRTIPTEQLAIHRLEPCF